MVSTTEKCSYCGGIVDIGMPCNMPCKPYPKNKTNSTGGEPWHYQKDFYPNATNHIDRALKPFTKEEKK